MPGPAPAGNPAQPTPPHDPVMLSADSGSLAGLQTPPLA